MDREEICMDKEFGALWLGTMTRARTENEDTVCRAAASASSRIMLEMGDLGRGFLNPSLHFNKNTR